jgi:hypothetical protein
MTGQRKKQVARKKQKSQKKALKKKTKASKKNIDDFESSAEVGSDDQDIGGSLTTSVTYFADFKPLELEAWKGTSGIEETPSKSLEWSEPDVAESISAKQEAYLDALRLSEFEILANFEKDYDAALNNLENSNESGDSDITHDMAESDVEDTQGNHRAHGPPTPDEANDSVLAAYKEIGAHCDALGISKSVSDNAMRLFKIANDAKALKKTSQEAIIAGCTFIACHQWEVPRTLREIHALTKIPEKDIARSFQALEKFFAEDSTDVKFVPGRSAAFLQWKEGDTSEKLDDLLEAKYANPTGRPCVLITFIQANKSGLPEILRNKNSSSCIRAAFLIPTTIGQRLTPETIFGPRHLGPRTRACALKYPHLHVGEAVPKPITEVDNWLEYLLPDGTDYEVYQTEKQNRAPSTSAQESTYEKTSVEDGEADDTDEFKNLSSPTHLTWKPHSPENVLISPISKPVSPTFNSSISSVPSPPPISPPSPVFQPRTLSGTSDAWRPMPRRQQIPHGLHEAQIPAIAQVAQASQASPAEYPRSPQNHQIHQAYSQDSQGCELSSMFPSLLRSYSPDSTCASASTSFQSARLQQASDGPHGFSGPSNDSSAPGEGWLRPKRKRPTASEVTDQAELSAKIRSQNDQMTNIIEGHITFSQNLVLDLFPDAKKEWEKFMTGDNEEKNKQAARQFEILHPDHHPYLSPWSSARPGKTLQERIKVSNLGLDVGATTTRVPEEDFIGLDVEWSDKDGQKPVKRKQKVKKRKEKTGMQKKRPNKFKAKNSNKFSGHSWQK